MQKEKIFLRGNFIFLFIVAFLVGVITKRAMGNHVRMGYDDPTTVISHGELYDIDVLEQELIRKGLPDEPTQEEVQ